MHQYLSHKAYVEFFLHPSTLFKSKKRKFKNFEFLPSLALSGGCAIYFIYIQTLPKLHHEEVTYECSSNV